MKPEDLFDRIGEADERYVSEARRKKKRRTWIPVSAVAAALVIVILVGAFLQPWGSPFIPGSETTGGSVLGNETTGRYSPLPVEPNLIYDGSELERFALSLAEYPLMVQYPADINRDYEGYSAWSDGKRAQREAYLSLSDDELPIDFFYTAMQAFLSDANGENLICSPVNVYMALAMLAETADGETRREILDALGEESIESLRVTANAVWNAHYCDDGAYTSVLASSLWLGDDLSYVEETVRELAEAYYTSVFRGEMGSEEYNEALRAWLNTQTGGMLSDQIDRLEMEPETVLAIATTVCFRARWAKTFEEEKCTEEIFHGKIGDVLCDFMNAELYSTLYYGDSFSAVKLGFEAAGGGMYLFLPEEDISAENLLADSEVLSLLSYPSGYEKRKTCGVLLSVPKFDVSSELDLTKGLMSLGIETAFDGAAADFSQITEDDDVALSEAKHGARVAIDEEGCVAAAFTILMLDGASGWVEEPIELTFDRPFVFVVTSEVGAPLFVGVVNNLQ